MVKAMLEPLPPGEPFPMNMQPSRIDRNALFVMNRVFPPESVAAARTEYKRTQLNFDDLKRDLLEFDCQKPVRQHSHAYYAVFESVRQDLGLYKHKVIPLTTGAVAKHKDFPASKSPGLPYKNLGYKTKGDVANDPAVMRDIRIMWYEIERGVKVELPDVACYARAGICGRSFNKVRSTWGFSMAIYLSEACYFYPILEVLKQSPHPFIAYGLEMMNGGMKYIHEIAESHKGNTFLLGDWSKFDKTIPAWLIRDAFKIIAEAIDWDNVQDAEGKIWHVRRDRSMRRWRKLVDYFIDTPIRLCNGERYIKHGGVPSGACFTNVIDSIVNMLVMRYLTYEMTGQLPHADVYLGDDSFLVLPKQIDLELFSQIAQKEFGMQFNDAKSTQTKDPTNIHFLGYFNKNGHPSKPLDTTIVSTIYPERPCLTKFETVARLLGQAFSCFEPSEADAFLKAGHMLAEEDNIIMSDVELFIRENPGRFKYLQTLGIDPTTITIPPIVNGVFTFRTQPSINRRRWKQRFLDVSTLYMKGLESYSLLSEMCFDFG